VCLQYLIKQKKIIFSLILLVILLISFFIFNKALKNENVYFPKLNDNKDYYIEDFSLPELFTNEKLSIKQLLEKKDFSIVNIWASWCVPCEKENSFLISLSNFDNLQIIGVNYKDRNKNAKSFLNKFGNPFNYNLVDSNGTTSIILGAYGVPETFLVNKNKKILLKIIGPINNNHLNEINSIIKK